MEFDYIVIGAGSAGCALAAGLTADSASSVLLVEAGGRTDSLHVQIPRAFGKLWSKDRFFWRFPSVNRRDVLSYGRGLGGSSAVNGMWYLRGCPQDYESWSPGSTVWTWDKVQEAFREMESYRDPGGWPGRGTAGPLEITQASTEAGFARQVFDAARVLGLRKLEDINTPATSGIGFTQQTVDRRGRRSSAYTAFLKGRVRPNLTVWTGCEVQRVLFEGTKAIGVAYRRDGQEGRVSARREIILSTGVLQTPRILQLSGIGPRPLLANLRIPVVSDLADVGRNMRGHILMALSFRMKGFGGLNRELRGLRLALHVLRYLATGRGPMNSGAPEITALLSTQNREEWPDVQIGVSPFSPALSAEGKPEPGRGELDRLPGVTFVGFQLRPESRGSVEIVSSDPAAPLKLDADYIKTEKDLRKAQELLGLIRRFAAAPAFSDVVGEELFPGNSGIGTDPVALLGSLVSPGLHDVGTCAMGKVVDDRLRVQGVAGLRIADCSVIPNPVSGNTNAPAMIVGWIASKILREDAGNLD